MCKKGLSVLVLLSLWMCLTGFASLGEEGKDTWNSMMEQLSAEEIDQLLAEENEWYGKVMANVEDSVTIRAEASSDSAAVGKMFKGDAGEILEQQEGWTRIQSGDVDGWVSDEYLAFGKDAEERAEEDVKKIATVTADGLKVRDEANTDSPVIDLIGHGEQIEVGEEEDGWLQIIYSDGEMDYISAEYVEVSYEYGQAKTMEEIAAEEAVKKAEEENRKAFLQPANGSKIPVSASETEKEKDSNTVPDSSKPVSDTRPVTAPKQLDFFGEKLLDLASRLKHKLIGQLFDTYWRIEYNDHLYIIDQHAAHEKVLYEKTVKSLKDRDYSSQMVEPPIILTLNPNEELLLNKYMEYFTRIGFEIEPFGGREFAVRAVPANLFSVAKKELLLEMIDGLSDEIAARNPDSIYEKIASMSCKAAVKGGNHLSAMEANELIDQLLKLDNPYACPHGRPTIISMSRYELEKKFKRIV